jgi:hypothetical protein
MMWQLGICSSYYPNGVSFCPFVVGQWGIGKHKFDSNVFQYAIEKTCKNNLLCKLKLWQLVQI